MNTKFLCLLLIILLFTFQGFAQLSKPKISTPQASDIKKAAQAQADQLGGSVFDLARNEFLKVAKNIPFDVGSYDIPLTEPRYKIQGYNLDSFMKNVLIPALSKIINTLPSGKKVIISGRCNAMGTEDGSPTFMGNKKLSQKRAEAVLEYLMNNSQLSRDKFQIEALSTSSPLEGMDPQDGRNCCVSFDIR